MTVGHEADERLIFLRRLVNLDLRWQLVNLDLLRNFLVLLLLQGIKLQLMCLLLSIKISLGLLKLLESFPQICDDLILLFIWHNLSGEILLSLQSLSLMLLKICLLRLLPQCV